jgi:hypothetical protein
MDATRQITNYVGSAPTTTTTNLFHVSIKISLYLIKGSNEPGTSTYVLSSSISLKTRDSIKRLAYQALIFITLVVSSALISKRADESKKEEPKGIGLTEIAKFVNTLWTINEKGISPERLWKLGKETTSLARSAGADSTLLRQAGTACSAMVLLSSDLKPMEAGRTLCVWVSTACKGETLGHIGKLGAKLIDILEILQKLKKERD